MSGGAHCGRHAFIAARFSCARLCAAAPRAAVAVDIVDDFGHVKRCGSNVFATDERRRRRRTYSEASTSALTKVKVRLMCVWLPLRATAKADSEDERRRELKKKRNAKRRPPAAKATKPPAAKKAKVAK